MAMFNGGRMVALLLCVLFAPNVSFAQDSEYETYILYMIDPVEEQTALQVEQWKRDWLDPLTWETFEDDFTPARDAQVERVKEENDQRIEAAKALLNAPTNRVNGEGIGSWVPSWIPLARAGKDSTDSLFSKVLDIKGAEGQRLEEFMAADGIEPDRSSSSGTRDCIRGERCAQGKDELFAFFDILVEAQRTGARIISLRFKASRSSLIDDPGPPSTTDPSFVEELETGQTEVERVGDDPPPVTIDRVILKEDSVRLLQPAEHDPNIRVIDETPYWQPAAKPVSSTETSSWARIKATFAD